MAANRYSCGTDVKCEVYFYSDPEKTTLADPSAVKFRYRTPAGVVTEHVYGTDAALVKVGTGHYYDIVNPSAEGTWKYVFRGTGTVAVTQPGHFEADGTLFEDF